MQAIPDTTKIVFNKVKIGFDVSMVAVSLAVCLLVLRELGSVGVGTIITSVLVGAILGVVNQWFGAKRDQLLFRSQISKNA